MVYGDGLENRWAQARVGSNPTASAGKKFPKNAPVAQWIEYVLAEHRVAGSSPAGRTSKTPTRMVSAFLCQIKATRGRW